MFEVQSLLKYLLEGGAVALAAYYIPRRNMNLQEVAMIALTAAAVFAVLDHFSPAVAAGARQGAGFGIGLNTVGGGQGQQGAGHPEQLDQQGAGDQLESFYEGEDAEGFQGDQVEGFEGFSRKF